MTNRERIAEAIGLDTVRAKNILDWIHYENSYRKDVHDDPDELYLKKLTVERQ